MKYTLQFKMALCAGLIFLLLGVGKIYAQTTFSVGDLNYFVNEDGVSVTVTGHVNGHAATGELVIPETVSYNASNYSVTSIGVRAFNMCFGLTGSLILPNSLNAIGERAFWGCSGFTGSLILPNSLNTIGEGAFGRCSGFTGSLTLPNSLTTIGNLAFLECSGFTGSLTLPNTLTSIGDRAFQDCSGFTGLLTLPNTLTSIGRDAFSGCSGFTGSLTLPDSLTSIGDWAFQDCSGFTGSLTLSNTLTSIGMGAFSYCGFTASLILPNTLTSIGQMAFWGCSGFTGSLVFPNSLASIGAAAFFECSGFDAVISLPMTPPELVGPDVFNGVVCSSLTVPCGCAPAYEASIWHEYFSSIVEDCSMVADVTENDVSVYPNPAVGMVHVEAENLRHISVFNELGQNVFETSADGDEFEFDLTGNEAGIYLIRIETAIGTTTKRIVLTK